MTLEDVNKDLEWMLRENRDEAYRRNPLWVSVKALQREVQAALAVERQEADIRHLQP